MKKTINLGMSMTLFLSACSPQKETVREIRNEGAKVDINAPAEIQNDHIKLWKELQVGPHANPAVAELVRASMSPATLAQLQNVEIPQNQNFLKEMSQAQNIQKRRLLIGSVPYYLDQQILSGTALFAADRLAISSEKFVQNIDLAREQALQRRAIETIDRTFENRSQEIAALLAPSILKQMPANDLSKIDAALGDMQQKAKAILPILKKYDRILANYQIAPNDEVRVLFLGAIATYLAREISENKTVKHLASKVQDAAKAAQLLQEAYSLIHLMEDKRKATFENLNNMKNAMTGIKSEVAVLRDQAIAAIDPQTKMEAKRALSDFVYGRTKEIEAEGILSRPLELPPKIQSFIDNAQSASKNMTEILKTATAISTKFGLKVDPGLAKALDTATKVSAAVQLGQTMLMAAATGGVIGALGAFGAGGGMSVLGLGGGDPMAADIAQIKEQLTEIKKLQQEMIGLQIDTIKMIQSLADLVTSFHYEQMYVLREIREEVALLKEIALISESENLRNCHAMIDFVLLDKNITTKNSVDYLSMSRSFIYNQISSRSSLEKLVKSVSEDAFRSCQTGISLAFGTTYADSHPMVAAMQSAENVHGPFSKDQFMQLVELWRELPFSKSSFGMHLPAVDGRTLRNKMYFARSAGPLDNPSDIGTLLSTEAIERYVAALLLLGPVTSFDKPDWERFLSRGVLEHQDLAWKRHHGFLNEALRKIQTAIAQESLIAGEPLLIDLTSSFSSLLQTANLNCEGKNRACVIKGNTLLRKNLLVYILNQRLGSLFFEDQYRRGLETQDIAYMERILGSEFKGRLVHIKTSEGDKEKTVLGVDWNFKNRAHESLQDALPSFSQIQVGKISYSENLKRLLSLQQKVVEAILEITPPSMSTESEEDYLKVMAVRSL